MNQFYHELIKFKNRPPRKRETKLNKNEVYKIATRLYNKCLKICFDEYNSIANVEKYIIDKNMILRIYFLKNMTTINAIKI